jgi:DNA-binding CsgD family transcriptional regulator
MSLSGYDNWAMERNITPREKEVLLLIAEGKTTKEIAETLHCADNTVSAHRYNLMRKTGARNAVELTNYATRSRLKRFTA